MTLTIAHLLFRLDVGGLERFMVDSLNRTCKEFRHVVVCLTAKGELAEQLDPSIEVIELNKEPGLGVGVHQKVFQLVRQHQIDIFHTYNLPAYEYHIAAKLAGVKYSLHAEHGRYASDPLGLNKKHRLLRKLVAPFINHIVCVSADMEEWMINYIGINSKKVTLIPNGINIDYYKPFDGNLEKENNQVEFLHVGRLDPVKDQKTLIAAFSLVSKKYPQCKLNIIGEGPERCSLEHQASALELSQNVVFHGKQLNTLDYFHRNQVFVMSSIAEGTPMTVLEAMSVGLPIVATSVGGLPDLVKKNGILVDAKDELALGKAMLAYLDSPSLISKHGKESRRYVESKL